MHGRTVRLSLAVIASAICFSVAPARSDTISPKIQKHDDIDYSNEKPNTAFYGTGSSGRLTEASALRFQGERETDDGHFDAALKSLGKAIQLDPGDPEGHVLYARALSAKINRQKSQPPMELVQRALTEWKMIWHHDADQLDQWEAQAEARRLGRIATALQKQLRREEKEHGKNSFVAAKTGQSNQ